jgi:hypothetical protein
MKIAHACGYWSDRAGERPRDPPFYEAYLFCWAVKSGVYKYDFFIDTTDGRVDITSDNFDEVRLTFGEWAARKARSWLEKGDISLVPIPSKSALSTVKTYGSLELVQEAFKGTEFETNALDALRWTKKLPKAHEGGPRSRADLLPLLSVRQEAKSSLTGGKNVILIDDLLVTGGSALACYDKLTAEGANVLGAITCGKAVYDKTDPPFGAKQFDLTKELSDQRDKSPFPQVVVSSGEGGAGSKK